MRRRGPKAQKVYAFIDSQNLNVSVQKYGWKMNWKKFRQFLTDKYGVDMAFMFIGYVPEHEDIYEKMHEAGYAVVLKPTFDMTNYDKAVIVSGDGDFFALVEYLQQQDKLLKILTPTAQYSSLFRQFEEYIERLDNHRRELAYHDRKPGQRPARPQPSGQV
jgi:hypothetical protein